MPAHAPPPTITVSVRMGRKGPVVTPNEAKVPKNGKVQWEAEDDGRWWVDRKSVV